MSSFDDWYAKYPASREQHEKVTEILRAAYNAGMERAAVIAARTGRHSDHSGSPASATPYYDAAIAIRKEIDNG